MILLSVVSAPALAQTNLLVNGDFEDGPTGSLANGVPGWNNWGTGGWHHNDAGAVIGGKGMKLWSGDTGMWQDFAAAPGMSYDYRIQVMDWSGDTTANNWDMRIEAEFYDASDHQIKASVLGYFDSSVEPDDIWTRIGGKVSAPAGTAYGRIVLRLWDWQPGVVGSLYFDSASVTVVRNPDYNRDFTVDYEDLMGFSQFWQEHSDWYDLNDDQLVDIRDLAIFAENWMAWQEPDEAEVIAVDSSVVHQEIEGFGASLTDSSAWLLYEFLNSAERQAVLTDLFDPAMGIGLSYLRQPMGASDFRLQEYSYDDLPAGISTDYNLHYFSIAYDEDYIIPTLQEILAINPEVRIMASPWSPPVWMKDSLQIGWGRLKSSVYPTYANYFVRFIQAYAAHGINIDAVTLQNEPYYEPGTYAGCRMEPADQVKLVKEMGPAFAQNNIATKILVWDHNWDNPGYPLSVLSDATARNYIAGTAWHHYGGDVSAQTTVHDAYPDKGIYFTEGSDGTWNDGGFEADLIRNGLFMVSTLQNWARTVIKWNLALDENNGPKIAGGCNTCYGVVTVNRSTRQVSPRPHYYALGHAAKFVRPGAVRVASQAASLKTVAFKNLDGTIALYVVNADETAQNARLEWGGQRLIRTIPARSIVTFKWADVVDAKAEVYLTTGDQTSLLERQRSVFFHE